MQKSNFLELVAKERTRQIIEKGYTAKHDDEHTDGSLSLAGACHAANELFLRRGQSYNYKYIWPWENPDSFCRYENDRKQQLIIAAAFINAEYDRIVRVEKKDSRCSGCNYLLSKDGNTWCGLDGMPMDEDDTRCEQYCVPPFEASEDNQLLNSFMRSSYE